jgi:uncharacterized repeat protein (TIGR03803 family)
LENGILYGVSEAGGTHRKGSVFQVDTNTGDGKILHSFTGGADGAFPWDGLVGDGAGNLYGATSAGGSHPVDRGHGVVFMVNATTGLETVLHTFTGGKDGDHPFGALVRDSQGNLYGTTEWGGKNNQGTLYKVDAPGTFTVLHEFVPDGGINPYRGLTMGPNGELYGVTTGGGNLADCAGGGCGTIFELKP